MPRYYDQEYALAFSGLLLDTGAILNVATLFSSAMLCCEEMSGTALRMFEERRRHRSENRQVTCGSALSDLDGALANW